MPTLQDALCERQGLSALILRIRWKLKPKDKRPRELESAASMASTQNHVKLYRTPVHFDISTGLTTVYFPPFIPRKRSADGRNVRAPRFRVEQQVSEPQLPRRHLFDLPQEMLDRIYEFCKDDIRSKTQAITKDYTGTTKAIIRDAPWTSLLKCSRKAAQDYKEMIWKTTTLELIDCFDALKALSTPPLHPTLLTNLTRLDTVLLAVCEFCECNIPHTHGCNVHDELQNHRAWLARLTATTPALKALNVKLYIQWPSEHHARVLRYPHSPHPFDLAGQVLLLKELNGFQRMEVHRFRAVQVDDGLDARKPEAECFDLWVVVIGGRDGWVREGSEEHRRLEREWWWERQWKGLRAWTDEAKKVSGRVGG